MMRTRFIAQRLVRLGVVLVSVVVLTFAMVHLTPGDPARAIAGAQADESAVTVARHEFGLDRSLPGQFGSYVSALAHGDLGRSFKTRQPVADIIAGRASPTYSLAVAALAMITVVGLTVGLLAGIGSRRGGRVFEPVFSAVTGGLAAMPHYLAATFLVFLFAVTWRVFPVAGSQGLAALVLPAAAVALRPAMMVARVIRVRVLEVVEQPYIRTAQSKRISPARLYLRHVLPNAATAALALGGVLFASLIGGAVVVELVFGRAGLGTELVRSVIAGDYPVVQGIALVLAATVVAVNLAVDVLLSILDPKTVEA